MDKQIWIKLGGISGFLAVTLGAFGAHALKPLLEQNNATTMWQTASLYHLIHSIAMLLPWSLTDGRIRPAAFFLAGTVCFSGSLYLLSLTGMKWLGPITPLGGFLFLGGWLLIVVRSYK